MVSHIRQIILLAFIVTTSSMPIVSVPPDGITKLNSMTHLNHRGDDRGNYGRYISYRCNTQQRLTEAVAWAEGNLLSQKSMLWTGDHPGTQGPFQDVFDLYMGTDSNNYDEDPGDGRGQSWHQSVQGPIVNQDRLRARVDSLDGVGKIFILCDEQDNPDEFYDDKKNCDQEHKTCCQPGTNAYSWSNIGSAWSDHYTIFCPQFFDRSTLSENIRWLKANPESKSDINKLYKSTGGTYYHEVFHYKYLIVNETWDWAYGAEQVIQLAALNNTQFASVNAESFMMAALAVFQMLAFNLTDPPRPGAMPSASDDTDNSGKFVGIYSTPEGARNVNDAKSLPDMTKWLVPPSLTIDTRDYENYTALPIPTPSCMPAVDFLPWTNQEYARGIINNQVCPFLATGAKQGGAVALNSTAPYAPIQYSIQGNRPVGDDDSLWASVSLVRQPECKNGFEISQSDCTNMFESIINGCQIGDVTAGGSVVYGCGIYDLRTSSGTGDTPPRGFTAENSDWLPAGT